MLSLRVIPNSTFLNNFLNGKPSSSMQFRRLCFSITKPGPNPFLLSSTLTIPLSISHYYPTFSSNLQTLRSGLQRTRTTPTNSQGLPALHTTNSTMDDAAHPESTNRAELFRALEANLGSKFTSEPIVPNPNPLIIVISGPSGVGKDAVIERLMEVRKDLHFVVTATTRAKRPGEVDGKDYIFVSKEEFLKMIEKNELLEYALVYGDYKGVPKQQIRDYMAKGYDIILRVDIQGASTLRRMLKDSAVFVFLVAESEEALVRRLIGRKTETVEALVVRVGKAREELRHLEEFDYVVVNKEGELEKSVKLVESIIEAEKAKVQQRGAVI